MEKPQAALTAENFISNWNITFPHYTLTLADLKLGHKVVGALFQVFDKLGIDRDAVTQPPPEEKRNEHMVYYWDLIPIINITRIVNHLLFVNSQGAKITITNFLQPTLATSHSVLLLLFNLMLFNEQRLKEIEPFEEELFSQSNQVKILEDRKNKLIELLNKQAEEKGDRARRIQKIESEQKQLEKELKEEKEAHDVEKQELDLIIKENKQLELLLEKKRACKDSLTAEVEKKRAQRVYDADDIKAKVEQAKQDVQEAEEKLNSLKTLLTQKENSLKHLQVIKPNLTTANNLLDVITTVSDSLKDFDDFESDHVEGQLKVYDTELSDLRAKYEELKIARAAAAKRREDGRARRQQEKMLAEMILKEAEEKEKKQREEAEKAAQEIQQLMQLMDKHRAEKAAAVEELASITKNFKNDLKQIEEELLKKASDAKKKVEVLLNRGV